ncbi:MAG: asparagine synthase (glutamine-hydrolyzing) [Gemmatimonadales bacterium]
MCGIAGIFSSRDSRTVATVMTDFLHHRGPDDVGVEELKSVVGKPSGAFGHRRLAIMDLSTHGHQPMFSHDERLCLTYNGEIYNFMELRAELVQAGVQFRSVCDTEVILEGWARQGTAFFARLRGMFALAIWDSVSGKGYLVRDVFGIKPLYVAERDGDVLFASEVRALLATERIPRKLSSEAVRSYLSTGSVAEPLTVIEGIAAIPPGCVVEITQREDSFVIGRPQRFSSLSSPSDEPKLHRHSHVHRIRNALRESVRYHLVSDVPVAVFLSGGIDSSAIAGLVREVSALPIETFTVVFEEAAFSEAVAARESAKRFGTQHHEIMLSGEDLLNALPDVFSSMDQPSLDGLNTFVVSRAVRSFGLKVVLSGLGGDELFGGYPSFHRAQTLAPIFKLPRAVRRLGAAGASSFADMRAARIGMLLRDSSPSHAAYLASRTLFGDRVVSRLMGRKVFRNDPIPVPDDVDISGMSVAQQVSLYEVTGYMRNTLLRDSDVFSMAHALELRTPFVDIEVARVAHEAAADLHLKPGSVKPLLVEAVSDLLPHDIIHRQKMGFTLPFKTWMRNELFSEVDSVLTGSSAENVRISPVEVRDIWRGFLDHRQGVTWSRPWALYTLMRWADQNDISYEPGDLRAHCNPGYSLTG